MKQAIMRRWVKDLRSKKYRQARGSLRATDSRGRLTNRFCCLGVLCNLYAKEHPKAQWQRSLEAAAEDCSAFVTGSDVSDTNTAVLPPAVMRWAGIKTARGQFSLTKNVRKRDLKRSSLADFECAVTLTQLNDHDKWDFKQIARFVEKHWRKL